MLSLAGVPIKRTDETQHFKFIGITGSGKTTAIGDLVEAALARGDRAIIADPDGVYARRFYDESRGDIIFNPFDARSPKWDIISEIQSEFDIDDLARALIPDLPNSHDHEWREYARTLFVDATRVVWEGRKRDPSAGSLKDLYELLTEAPVEKLREMLPGTPSATFLNSEASKMFASIRGVLGAAVRSFKYTDESESRSLSIRDWVNRGKREGSRGVLFLPYSAKQIAALNTTISAWMRLGIFEAMEGEEGDQRLWFVMDELGALGRIGGLSDGLTRLRKFGGRVALGFQSIDQVQGIYGKHEANAIVENCGNSLLLRCGTADEGGTSKFASKLIGEREVLRTTISRQKLGLSDFLGPHAHRNLYGLLRPKTESQHLHTEPAVLPAQMEQLPNYTGYLRVSSQPEWMRVKLARPKNTASEARPRKRPWLSSLFSRLKRMIFFWRRGPPKTPAADSPAAPASYSPSTSIKADRFMQTDPTPPVLDASINRIEPGTQLLESDAAPPANNLQAGVEARFDQDRGPITRVIRGMSGNEIHQYSDGTRAFERFGKVLQTPHDDPQIVRTLVEEAQERKWKHIRPEGTQRFNSQVWDEATRHNIKVHGYEPTPEQRAALAARRKERAEAADARDNRIRRAHLLDRATDFVAGRGEEGGNIFWRTAKAVVRRGLDLGRSLVSGSRSQANWATADNAHESYNSVEYMEPREASSRRQSHAASGASRAERNVPVDRETVPEAAIKAFFYRQGRSQVYKHKNSDAEAFRDEGLALKTQGTDFRTIRAMVQIAEARKWKSVNLTGSEEFRREAWLQAAYRGLEVNGFAPNWADRTRLSRMREQSHAESHNSPANAPAAQTSASASATREAPDRKKADEKPETKVASTPSSPAAAASVKSEAGRDKGRKWSEEEKNRILKETDKFGKNVAEYLDFLKREGVEQAEVQEWAMAAKKQAAKAQAKEGPAATPEARPEAQKVADEARSMAQNYSKEHGQYRSDSSPSASAPARATLSLSRSKGADVAASPA